MEALKPTEYVLFAIKNSPKAVWRFALSALGESYHVACEGVFIQISSFLL